MNDNGIFHRGKPASTPVWDKSYICVLPNLIFVIHITEMDSNFFYISAWKNLGTAKRVGTLKFPGTNVPDVDLCLRRLLGLIHTGHLRHVLVVDSWHI